MKRTLFITAFALMLPLAGVASEVDDPTSLSYISYLERYATVSPPDSQEPLEAVINMPLVSGDRLDTAREARIEAVLSDGSLLWLDEYTSVSLDSVAFSRDTRGDRTVLYLGDGAVMLELPATVDRENRTRIDGASETVYLHGPGVFRIEVLRTGGLWVEVWEGVAEAATPMGGVILQDSTATEVGDGRVTTTASRLTDRDEFARWVQARRTIEAGPSTEYVDARYARQAAQLDAYGTWVYVDTSDSWAWRPTTVSSDWRPYTVGRWYWTDVGWSWLAYEPWGWLPYHYGSWSWTTRHGWVWSWGSVWSPAWVHWSYGNGYIGWCPTGWYSTWWWDRGWGWDRHHHHGGHYPGHRGPSRGDVIPRRSASGRSHGGSNLVLDLEGRSRRFAMDARAWSVVSEQDFASARVGAIARSGTERSRWAADRDATAIISSKPLLTKSPRSAVPEREISRVFSDRARTHTEDLTPVVARSDSLSQAEAFDRVTPRSVGAMAGRRTLEIDSGSTAGRVERAGPSVRRQPVESRPTLERRQPANPYRSTYGSTGAAGSGSREGTRSRTPVTPSSRSSSITRRTTSDQSSTSSPRRIAPSTRSTTERSRPSGQSTETSQGTRPSVGSSRTAPSRSPVVVPRTSPSSETRSSRTPVAPRVSSGRRSAPSPRASAPSVSPGSSSRRTSPSTRSSTSSGSSRSAPRASTPSRSSSSRSSSSRATRSRSSGSSSSSSTKSSAGRSSSTRKR